MEGCPDAEWRPIFALARFGGLQCPSETLPLKWSHINWENNSILVPSPKTEHSEGKESRIIPICRPLYAPLRELYEQTDPGTIYVIKWYREKSWNLRTQLNRIISQTGLKPWPKPWQNLRPTRETGLAERNPIHAVCEVIGNSEAVAMEHYLRITKGHLRQAMETDPVEAAQNAAQQPTERACTGPQAAPASDEKPYGLQGLADACSHVHDSTIPQPG